MSSERIESIERVRENEDFINRALFLTSDIPELNENEKHDPVIERVRKKLLQRSTVGLNKYGVGLDRTDLSRLDWLRHLQEELMDAAGYLEVLITDEELICKQEHNLLLKRVSTSPLDTLLL